MFYRLLYISTARKDFNPGDLDAIMKTAQKRNRANKITGLLVFDGRRFMQYLEGEESIVRATFARIELDLRHYAVVVLKKTEGSERQFSNWDMAYRLSDSPGAFDAQVKQVVALSENCDSLTAADLVGFTQKRAA
jgi:Sensors of blue-light using FAD